MHSLQAEVQFSSNREGIDLPLSVRIQLSDPKEKKEDGGVSLQCHNILKYEQNQLPENNTHIKLSITVVVYTQ